MSTPLRVPVTDTDLVDLLEAQRVAEARIETLTAAHAVLEGRLMELKARAALRQRRIRAASEALAPEGTLGVALVRERGQWWAVPQKLSAELAALVGREAPAEGAEEYDDSGVRIGTGGSYV